MTKPRQPAVFFGHGSPMNALGQNRNSRAWAQFGERYLRGPNAPAAILCVSAHWYGPGTAVTAQAQPQTIHDFGGFPQALFDVRYPAPGYPALARRIVELLAPLPVELDEDWGLDHGTWSVLLHAAPQATIPVLQLSIDATQPPAFHYQLGQKLGALRDQNVLLMGSGDTVHNLRRINWNDNAEPHSWATQFDKKFLQYLRDGDTAPLIDYSVVDEEASLAVPTPDHYLPILYVLGARRPDDELHIVNEGIEHGSISMLAFAYV